MDVSLIGLAEPRFESEMMFRLAAAPTPAWTNMPCSAALSGSLMDLRSCSRSSPIGSFLPMEASERNREP